LAYQSAKADTRTEVRFGNYAPKLGRSPSDAETPKPVIHRSLITVHRANAGPESRRLLSPQWTALVWITDPRSSPYFETSVPGIARCESASTDIVY